MRITAGTAKGRQLFAPRGNRTRPTSDKVRAAIFNILGQFFDGGRVLDLYAGTGALALEALSRGFTHATCVDSDRHAADAIARNATTCGFSEHLTLERAPVLSTIPKLATRNAKFDLVFIDPPYAEGPEPALQKLEPLLTPTARVVAEHASKVTLAPTYGGLTQIDQRRFGDTAISIFAPASP